MLEYFLVFQSPAAAETFPTAVVARPRNDVARVTGQLGGIPNKQLATRPLDDGHVIGVLAVWFAGASCYQILAEMRAFCITKFAVPCL